MLFPTEREITHLIETCCQAGTAILEVYAGEVTVERKADASPLTLADLRSHDILARRLAETFPGIPLLSEENAEQAPYELRRHWSEFWLIDPLDGTKEFLKKNGQFTINVALIQRGRPVFGLVYAPVAELVYFGGPQLGAFRQDGSGHRVPLPDVVRRGGPRVIVGSRSHHSPAMDEYLAEQRHRYGEVEFLAMGSALKMCAVAEGRADVYPRFGTTMEWDTAAGHAIANAAGRKVLRYGSAEELTYNKEDLRNGWFIVE